MTDKILELTEKIYNEGVVKAKTEADQIIADAKTEAGRIVKSAKKQAAEIIDQAKKQTAEIKKNTNSELQLAARQFMSKLKQLIVSIITTAQVEPTVNEAFNDIEFVKTIILTIIQNWNSQKPEEFDLTVLLPKKDEKVLSGFFKTKAFVALNKGIDIQFDSKINKGFKIGPKNGSYILSFSEKDFENYFTAYIKNRTKELLFVPHQ